MTKRRAALLLEMMLSVALFAAGGLAILALVRQNMAAVEHARLVQQACDLAESAMNRIASGMAEPASLAGPVAPWDGRGAGVSIEPDAGDTLWSLQIDTAPAEFAGLTHVTVRAMRLAAPGSERAIAQYTLHQLVHLGAREEGTIGEADELAAHVAPDAGGAS